LENGSLTFAGQQVRLLAARKLQALFGAEIISGSDIALEKLTKLLLGTDAITLTGQDISLLTKLAGNINLVSGSFFLQGFDVNLLKMHAPELENTIHSLIRNNTIYSMGKNNRVTYPHRITGN
jgi:hypothetical protein